MEPKFKFFLENTTYLSWVTDTRENLLYNKYTKKWEYKGMFYDANILTRIMPEDEAIMLRLTYNI